MRREIRTLMVVLAAAVAVAVGGCRGGSDSGTGSGSAGVPSGGEANLRREVGQLLIASFSGQQVPGYMRQLLRSGRAGGVILFDGNVAGISAVRGLTHDVQKAARGKALVVTDDEGGTLMSVPTDIALPAPPDFNADIEGTSTRVGQDLRRRGVNVDLAPVADVTAPHSFIKGRAFRGDPAEVATSVRSVVRGFQAAHLGAAVKHFPGLGHARRSTDDFSIAIGTPRPVLMDDLEPFRAAIAAGAPVVMASHALYPALDKHRIASQSKPILEGLLRGELGFDGAVMTDSIEARAVIHRSSVAAAAARSIEAGADLVLMTGRGSWIRVYPKLVARARHDKVFRARVHEAAGRVAVLKKTLGLAPPAR